MSFSIEAEQVKQWFYNAQGYSIDADAEKIEISPQKKASKQDAYNNNTHSIPHLLLYHNIL
jgi:hypothetical protein